MLGVFKKLNANDIKITPFEAHKYYSSNILSSIGVSTSSAEWSNSNKADFSDSNRKWFQIDKLYYRDFIGKNRANLLELNDANYQQQERRLYDSASIISISQTKFGNEVQPNTFTFIGGGITFKDDGYGNLYDNSKGLTNWPDERYRVFYLGPVKGFKKINLNIDNDTGNPIVGAPSQYSFTEKDDSYFRNTITYTSCSFETSSEHPGFTTVKPYLIGNFTKATATTLALISTDKDFVFDIPGVGEFSFIGDDGSSSDVITPGETTLYYVTGSGIYASESFQNLRDKINNTPRSNGFLSASWSSPPSGLVNYLHFTASYAGTWANGIRFIKNNPGGGQLLYATLDGGQIYEANNEGYVKISNQSYLNPNDQDFAISFYIHPSSTFNTWMEASFRKAYIITKKNLKTALLGATIENPSLGNNLQSVADTINRIPYECYLETFSENKFNPLAPSSASFNFIRRDDKYTTISTANISTASLQSGPTHVLLQRSSSRMQIWINGIIKSNTVDNTITTQNQADVTVFSNRITPTENAYPFPSPISQLMFWDKAFNSAEIINISESITGTYPVGNIFYNNGFATITHPSYVGSTTNATCSFKNTHPITEYEYQCTVGSDEFNVTTNQTTRKTGHIKDDRVIDFATGSDFRPYITTVGLYDDDANLLLVGKLGQPIRTSNETDTTFVVRFDT